MWTTVRVLNIPVRHKTSYCIRITQWDDGEVHQTYPLQGFLYHGLTLIVQGGGGLIQ